MGGETSSFLGIPYAKAPVGKLRWMPPEAYGAWESPRDATQYGAECLGVTGKAVTAWDGSPGKSSEDCLFLNIVGPTSALNGPATLPVLFWIYGGAYDSGSSQTYPLESLVGNAGRNIIAVSTNYRTNIFGFLGSKQLAARARDGSTGNYGVQDQRMAMQWVKDHISAFGGHGHKVTIFGESAGGNSVLHHLVQPASFGLYRSAIIESGTYDAGYPLSDAQVLYDELVNSACKGDAACVLELPADAVQRAKDKAVLAADQHWGPVIDGVATLASPQDLIAQGKFNKVPVMLGANVDEFGGILRGKQAGLLKLAWAKDMDETAFDRIFSYLGANNLQTVKQLYQPSVYDYPDNRQGYSEWWWAAMRISTDNGVPTRFYPSGFALGHCSARRVAINLAKHYPGRCCSPVFLYSFARTPFWDEMVSHGDEMPYVFHADTWFHGKPIGQQLGAGDRELRSSMTKYWSNFAATGAPSSTSLPAWPTFTPAAGTRANIRFDATGGAQNVSIQHDYRTAACDFWDGLHAQQRKGTAPGRGVHVIV